MHANALLVTKESPTPHLPPFYFPCQSTYPNRLLSVPTKIPLDTRQTEWTANPAAHVNLRNQNPARLVGRVKSAIGI
jgi:hypothetical protein